MTDEKNDSTSAFSTVEDRVAKADAAYVMPTYSRYPVEFVSGHDATLVDSTGKEYIDLLGGIGCASLGHANPAVKQAIVKQLDRVWQTSNYFYDENRVRLARINETQSRTDYERMKALYDDGLVSAEEFEQTRLAYDQAKEETVAAEDALQITKEGISRSNASYSTTLIRSTIDGLILDVPVKVGNSVIMSNTFNDGTTIASVADMTDLVFKGTIDETEVARIHEGMPVKITVGALQGQTFTATLEYIAPKVSSAATSANQFEIKAAVKIPAGVKIRAGYSANAEIVLERKERALSVPEGGIEYSGDSTFVYVLTGERPQTFARRQVVTGMSDGVNIEIARGLKAGDKVRGNKNEAQN